MSTPDRYRIDSGVALVTGAASGMGASMARLLAERGSNLALADKDKDGLSGVASALQEAYPGLQISSYALDLGESEAGAELVAGAMADHGRLTLVINNAGVALAGRFEQLSMDDVDWLLAINLRGVLAVTSAALPHLDRGAHITNMSSLFGIIAPPGNSVYSASKFGIRGFSSALRQELQPRGIGVTSVHPGGIRTAIARTARIGSGVTPQEWDAGLAIFEKFLVIDPDDAAALIIRGTERRKPRVLIGPEAYAGDVLSRIAPVGYEKVFETLMRWKAKA